MAKTNQLLLHVIIQYTSMLYRSLMIEFIEQLNQEDSEEEKHSIARHMTSGCCTYISNMGDHDIPTLHVILLLTRIH